MRAMGFWLIALAALPGGAAEPDPRARVPDEPNRALLAGDEAMLSGRLVDLVVDQHVTLQHEDQSRKIPWEQFVLWGRYVERPQGTHLLLADGSVLAADVLRIEQGAVVTAGRLWTETALPQRQVRAILFQPPLDAASRDRLLERLLAWRGPRDRLILDNGDEVAGRLQTPLRPEAGAFYPASLSWRLDGQTDTVDIATTRVRALAWGPARADVPRSDRAAFVAGFRDGSLLSGEQIQRSGGTLTIKLACGAELTTEPVVSERDSPWDAVTFVQPLTSTVTYVSDLQPLGYAHTPFLDVSWPYREDRTTVGTRLRHAGGVHVKGLGMHSSARLAYQLAGRYRWFQAELAIDARAGRHGSVVFRVFLQDAAGTWRPAYTSPVVRGGEAALAVRVDVRGASRMALLVEFADRADQWDHANWLNARLVP